MDIYARNFNRNKDLSSEDLLWFGRVETERHYTYLDEEVKDGLRSKGDLKEGIAASCSCYSFQDGRYSDHIIVASG